MYTIDHWKWDSRAVYASVIIDNIALKYRLLSALNKVIMSYFVNFKFLKCK